ncbi:MAG: plastocyanin/azurin family copper-binding protein [Dokdonella sp.]
MRSHLARIWPIGLLLFGASSSWAATHTVTVGGAGLTFSPSTLTIDVGDTVTFVKTAAGGFHNVHASDNSFRCAATCANDGSGGTGDPTLGAFSQTVTFNTAGTVNYFCDVHQSMGMTGSITVNPATTPPPATVPITNAFSGAWFDPNQSGHGILLEVVAGTPPAGNSLIAYWFTFNPDGTQQAWFGGVGPITGDTAVVDAVQTTGGRWIPNFDPATIVNNPWGTMTFTFTDCNTGRVDFSSTITGFGSNHMDLIRLTQLAGLSCP